MKRIYIICGYENTAKEVAKKLTNVNFNILVLDDSKERIEEAKKDKYYMEELQPENIYKKEEFSKRPEEKNYA